MTSKRPNGCQAPSRKKNSIKVVAATKLEQEILQGAVDGVCVDFFRGLPSARPDGVKVRVQADDTEQCWWLHIFDKTHGCSVLHWAAGMGNLGLVEFFLTEFGDALDVEQQAQGNSLGRTALHYACRNGHLDVARYLVEKHNANVVPVEAHHGVTPFHLAVWRKHTDICMWLVNECGVDAGQANVFGCTAIHWLGLIPNSCLESSENDGSSIHELAEWLCNLPNVNVYAKQKQGHSALHKAAWGGHLRLCQYFHEVHGMYDDSPDESGNYAADLADMGGRVEVAQYLRTYCSAETVGSCQALGLTIDQRYDHAAIKAAFYGAARKLHPDRLVHMASGSSTEALVSESRKVDDFVLLLRAYRHLTDEDGVGSQRNSKHELPLLLTDSTTGSFSNSISHGDKIATPSGTCDSVADHFASQLTAVVLEYGKKGLDISNLRKKWRQLWPETEFPAPKKGSLKSWLGKHANHIVTVRKDEKNGGTRVYANYLPT